jgi:D-sedoheptulose 7-phosphate isomerase
VAQAISMLTWVFRDGKELLAAGSGGSVADADHIVGELVKSFVKQHRTTESA